MVITYLERIEWVEADGKWYSISRVILCISESLSTQKQMILNVSELLSGQRRPEIRVLAARHTWNTAEAGWPELCWGGQGEQRLNPFCCHYWSLNWFLIRTVYVKAGDNLPWNTAFSAEGLKVRWRTWYRASLIKNHGLIQLCCIQKDLSSKRQK